MTVIIKQENVINVQTYFTLIPSIKRNVYNVNSHAKHVIVNLANLV